MEKREGKSILSLPAATDASDELPGVFDGAADALAEHEARVHRPELVVDRGPAGFIRRRLPHPLRIRMSLNLKSTLDGKMANFLGLVPNWVRLDSIRLIE